MELSLRFENNETGHGDLILTFAGRSWAADSYFLALDRGLLPDREDADKVRAVLRRLLEQWRQAVEAVADGGDVYLPYDFSDEYTGWLHGRRSGGMIALRRGWATQPGGYAISPSEIGAYLTQLDGFQTDELPVRCDMAELLLAIRRSMQEA